MNNQVIKERLSEMDENIRILEDLRDMSLDVFSTNPKIYKLAERCFQLAIECVIDICHYIIAQNNWVRPADNAEAILRLGEHGVIPNDFATKIFSMVSFRNILVHAYLKIDRSIVFDNLQELNDFIIFQEHVIQYMERNSDKNDTS